VIYIGIDPGKSGGMAAIVGSVAVYTKMPATERDVLDWFSEWPPLNSFALLERAQTMPRQGVVSAFTYGRGYGALLMALTATKIPFDLVAPAVWQRAMGCLSRGDKNVTKRRAQQLFPKLTVTHAIADALLLAEYRRRLDWGTGGQEKEQGDEQGQEELPERTLPANGGAFAGRQTKASAHAPAAPGAAHRRRPDQAAR
jgi:hypothetical protein